MIVRFITICDVGTRCSSPMADLRDLWRQLSGLSYADDDRVGFKCLILDKSYTELYIRA